MRVTTAVVIQSDAEAVEMQVHTVAMMAMMRGRTADAVMSELSAGVQQQLADPAEMQQQLRQMLEQLQQSQQ